MLVRDGKKDDAAKLLVQAEAERKKLTGTCNGQPFDDLRALYSGEGIDGSKPVIAYCRIGERSSHTWFVLKYLLGLEHVTNYDGSWTEWARRAWWRAPPLLVR